MLEQLAIKLALFFFTNGKWVKVIHFQIDKVNLPYLLKMRWRKNGHIIKLRKQIWRYLNHKQNHRHKILAFRTEQNRKQDIKEQVRLIRIFGAVCPLLGRKAIETSDLVSFGTTLSREQISEGASHITVNSHKKT